MGPQPGSDALLAEENLRARFPDDLRRSTTIPLPPSLLVPRYENGPAMKTEFSCVCDATVLIVSGDRSARSATIKYGGTSRRQTTGVPEHNRLLRATPCVFFFLRIVSSRPAHSRGTIMPLCDYLMLVIS